MYKLIAIDIDGTLLNSRGELSARTKDVVRRVTSSGVEVVLTSGRVSESVSFIANEVNASKYIICDNGALIYDNDEKGIISASYINKDTVLKLVETCVENNIYYMVFTTKRIIVRDLKHMALAFYKKRHNLKEETSGMAEIVFGGIELIKESEEPFTRIVVCDQDRVIYNSIVHKLQSFDGVELMAVPHVSNKIIRDGDREIFISYSYAELLAKGTNKWTAITKLADKLNIKHDEVMAIGDNFNDIEMIKNAGLGVAVSNGSPVAKAVAEVIAPSNDQDGVAVVLENYVLRKRN
jgi:Cof subfamily protein (haloacid dehalogenase superfamily)